MTFPWDQIPITAKEFALPESNRTAVMWCATFFGLVGLAMLFLPLIVSTDITVIARLSIALCLLSLSVFCFVRAPRLRGSAFVAENGLYYVTRGRQLFLSWDEMASIRADDDHLELIVSDRSSVREIVLSYQLGNFDRLRQLLIDRAPAEALQVGNLVEFHCRRSHFVIQLLGLLFLTCAGYAAVTRRDFWLAAISMCLLIFLLWLFSALPYKLNITPGGFVVYYPFTERKVFNSEITRVDIQNEGDGRWAMVLVERMDVKPMVLVGFREGSLALYQALRNNWQTHASSSPARNR